MRNAGLEEAQAVIKIAGRTISNLRYADDKSHGWRSLVGYSVEESRTQLKRQCVRARAHTHALLYGFSHFLTHLTLELSSLKVHLKCSLYSLKVALNSYSFQNQEAQKP